MHDVIAARRSEHSRSQKKTGWEMNLRVHKLTLRLLIRTRDKLQCEHYYLHMSMWARCQDIYLIICCAGGKNLQLLLKYFSQQLVRTVQLKIISPGIYNPSEQKVCTVCTDDTNVPSCPRTKTPQTAGRRCCVTSACSCWNFCLSFTHYVNVELFLKIQNNQLHVAHAAALLISL